MFSAKEKFNAIVIETSARRKNEHIGSGRGGNPEMFLTLLALNHVFETGKDTPTFIVDADNLRINCDRINKLKLREVRDDLDAALTSEVINEYAHPELVQYLDSGGIQPNGKVLELTKPLNELVKSKKQEILITGFQLANKLKSLVEKEIKEGSVPAVSELSTELQQVYNDMLQLEDWVVVASLRTQLGIEFLVKYNLDEIFGELLGRVNRRVESIS